MPEKDNYTCNVFKHLYFAPYTISNQYKLFNAVRGNKETIQRLKLLQKLPAHNGCVNTVSWNESGEFLLSGSDDQKLCITNGYTYKILTSIHTNHRANIFSAKFLPNASDKKVISCAGDGIIIFTHLDHIDDGFSSSFNCHFGTAYKIVTVPNDPHTFLSCGEDGTVRWYDLRIKQSCSRVDCREDILINCRRAVTALAVNPISPYQLAVGCSDSHVQLFDRRMIGTKATGSAPENTSASVTRFTVAGFENRSHRITSLVYSSNAEEMLVSYSSEYLYLFRLKDYQERDDKGAAEFRQSQNKNPTTPSLMKRLRLRGDWSDTGPNARPEREMQESLHRPSIHTTLMQRMSDVLMRMLNEPGRSGRSSSQVSTSNPTSSQEEGLNNPTNEDLSSSASVAFTDSEESVGISESSQTTIHSGTSPHILVTTAEDTPTHQSEPASVTDNLPSRVEPVSTLSEEVQTTAVERVESVSNICDKEQKQTLTPAETNKNDSVEDSSDQERIPMSDVTSSNVECATASSSVEETVMMEPSEASTSSSTKDIVPEGFENHRNESESNKNLYLGSSQDLGSDNVAETKSDLQSDTRQTEPIPSPQPEQISEEMESNENMPLRRCRTPLFITFGDMGCTNLPVVEVSSDSEHELHDTNLSSLEPSTLSEPSCNDSEQVTHPFKENKMSVDKSGEECSDISLDKTEDSSTSIRTFEESSESSSQISESTTRNKPIQLPEPSSNSSSSEEELTRCWFRRHSRNADPRSDLSGDLVRNMDEALASPSEETISANGGKHYYYYLPPPKLLHKFTGHRNARTMIKEANFWGDHYVMSGSDCGHIFFWDRHTAEVVMILEADRHVVNCIQPHPFDPVLASSGIDYDIKLWAPLQEEPSFDKQMASEIMLRNEVMLEETRDTITVPASFMIRMLASLNHLRTGARQRSSPSQSSQEN